MFSLCFAVKVPVTGKSTCDDGRVYIMNDADADDEF